MIYNRSIEGSSSLPQYKAKVTTMLKDMDFGVYGKGVDGYVHYSLAMIVSGKKRKTVRR